MWPRESIHTKPKDKSEGLCVVGSGALPREGGLKMTLRPGEAAWLLGLPAGPPHSQHGPSLELMSQLWRWKARFPMMR